MKDIFQKLICNIFRCTIDRQQAILDEIKKCTAAMNTTVIDQSAYIRASAAKKKMNLEPFREDVRRELNSPNPSQSSVKGDVQYYFSLVLRRTAEN